MDKFLAKKQQLDHSLTSFENLKNSIMLTLIHISLKSLYETLRLHSFTVFGYQQIQTDVYFLFTVVKEFITCEEAHAK